MLGQVVEGCRVALCRMARLRFFRSVLSLFHLLWIVIDLVSAGIISKLFIIEN